MYVATTILNALGVTDIQGSYIASTIAIAIIKKRCVHMLVH